MSAFLRLVAICPVRRLPLLLVGFLALGSQSVRGTILLFNESRSATGTAVQPISSGANVPQDYGDRVGGSSQNVSGGQFTYGEAGEGFTPSVVVDYFSDGQPSGVSMWENDYGDLSNVIFGQQNSSTMSVRLAADLGFEVLLYGFDIAGWSNADYQISAVRVVDNVAEQFSATDVLIQGDANGPRHTSFEFPTPMAASELTIEIDYSNLSGNLQDNIGVDNIRFGQDPMLIIPEPGSIELCLMVIFTLLIATRPTSCTTVSRKNDASWRSEDRGARFRN